jgi:hypothetical protein
MFNSSCATRVACLLAFDGHSYTPYQNGWFFRQVNRWTLAERDIYWFEEADLADA